MRSVGQPIDVYEKCVWCITYKQCQVVIHRNIIFVGMRVAGGGVGGH